MTFPNDDPRATRDPQGITRDPTMRTAPRDNSMMWMGLVAAVAVLGIMIYAFSGPTNVASNDTPNTTTTTRTNPPAATPPAGPAAPSGTTGTSPAPTPAPATPAPAPAPVPAR